MEDAYTHSHTHTHIYTQYVDISVNLVSQISLYYICVVVLLCSDARQRSDSYVYYTCHERIKF